MPTIKPEDVLKHTEPSKGFLCKLSDNTYNIEFQSFRIRDMETNKVYFELQAPPDSQEGFPEGFNIDDLPDEVRTVRYTFSKEFLELKTIGTSLVFSVGDKPVPNFRMIERHYFKNKLLKNFDFKFGFCIPKSTNSWEAIYTVPPLSDKEKKEIIANPWEMQSDSFYFVGDELIMHNKAMYSYSK